MNAAHDVGLTFSQVPASQAEKLFVTSTGLKALTLEIDYLTQLKNFMKLFQDYSFGAFP